MYDEDTKDEDCFIHYSSIVSTMQTSTPTAVSCISRISVHEYCCSTRMQQCLSIIPPCIVLYSLQTTVLPVYTGIVLLFLVPSTPYRKYKVQHFVHTKNEAAALYEVLCCCAVVRGINVPSTCSRRKDSSDKCILGWLHR